MRHTWINKVGTLSLLSGMVLVGGANAAARRIIGRYAL